MSIRRHVSWRFRWFFYGCCLRGVRGDASCAGDRQWRVAVVLDFVDPQRTGRRSSYLGRLARFDEAGRTPPLQSPSLTQVLLSIR